MGAETRITITLPTELLAEVEAGVAAGDDESVNDAVVLALEEREAARRRYDEARLAALIQEGVNSGPAVDAQVQRRTRLDPPMRVGLSQRAERDLEDIGDYIALDSRRAALRVVLGLRKACAQLSYLGAGFPVLDFGPPTLRRHFYGPYHIYFTIDADTIRVERILHGARDIPAAFGGD
jgi:toxin ParE1/3/4